jgi:cell division protein FtsZ
MAPFEFNPIEDRQDEQDTQETGRVPASEPIAEPVSEPTPEPAQARMAIPEPAPESAPEPTPEPAPEPSRFEFDEDNIDSAKIKVIGVGGGGGNAINYMISRGLDSVEYIALNTDAQALKSNHAGQKMQIGSNITGGLGAGARPEVGKEAMEESRHEVEQLIEGADMVFITAGMGGGTGTGGAPIVASMAKRKGMLTVGIVTMPFDMEGASRKRYAMEGLTELKANCDTIIMIPNDRLLELSDEDTSMVDAFGLANSVLYNATRGISDLILLPGLINLDFADVRTTMLNGGASIMGSAASAGPERAEIAAHEAIHSPLLDGVSIRGARNVLVNISAGRTLGMRETSVATSVIQQEAGNDAEIILGTVIDDSLGEEMRVTVIATGFDEEQALFNHMNRSNQTGASTHRKPEAPTPSSMRANPPMQGPALYTPTSSNGVAQGPSQPSQTGVGQTLGQPSNATSGSPQEAALTPSHTNPHQMDMKIESTDFYKGEQNLKNLDAPAIHRRDLRFSQGQHVANEEAGTAEAQRASSVEPYHATANPVFKTHIGNGLTSMDSTALRGGNMGEHAPTSAKKPAMQEQTTQEPAMQRDTMQSHEMPSHDMPSHESQSAGASAEPSKEMSSSSPSTESFHARVGKQKIDKSNSDQPAFLRRIMD